MPIPASTFLLLCNSTAINTHTHIDCLKLVTGNIALCQRASADDGFVEELENIFQLPPTIEHADDGRSANLLEGVTVDIIKEIRYQDAKKMVSQLVNPGMAAVLIILELIV